MVGAVALALMDVVYPLGTGSRWSNNELRYSLRSLEMYYPDIGNVYVVGNCPSWVAGVNVVGCLDLYGKDYLRNALAKVMSVAVLRSASDSLLLMNDDMYLLREMADFPHCHVGPFPSGSPKGYYPEADTATLKYLRVNGVAEPLNFAIHRPRVIDRNLFREICWPLIGRHESLRWDSVYFNLARVSATYAPDVKARSWEEWQQLKQRPDLDCFSTSNGVVRQPKMQRLLSTLFPTRSRFEKV